MDKSKDIYQWWGYNIDLPEDFDKQNPTIHELIILFLFITLIAQLILYPLLYFFYGNSLILNLLLFIFTPIFLYFLYIIGVLKQFSKVVILARQKGTSKELDKYIIFICLFGILLTFYNIFKFNSIFFLLLNSFLIILFAKNFQEETFFTSKIWEFVIPDFLKETENIKPREENGKIILREDNSNCTYTMKINDREYEIGILLREELIKKLRYINKLYDGMLYEEMLDSQNSKDFVHLKCLTEKSENNLTKEEQDEVINKMILLSRQFLYIIKKENLSLYRAANLILNYVQVAIKYEYDHNSTKEFPGGPYEEYGRFAPETIYDKVGDCECTALLALSLLSFSGFNTVFLLVPGHALMGLEIDDSLKNELGNFYNSLEKIKLNNREFLIGETATESEVNFGAIPLSENVEQYEIIEKYTST